MPDILNDIKLVHIKIGSFDRKEAKNPRKSSSVIKGLNILVSHLRAVKYVLTIVGRGPLFAYIVYEGYLSPPFHITRHFHEDSELMIESIKHCLDLVVNQERKCSYQFKDTVRFQTLVELTFESEKSRMLFSPRLFARNIPFVVFHQF